MERFFVAASMGLSSVPFHVSTVENPGRVSSCETTLSFICPGNIEESKMSFIYPEKIEPKTSLH